MNGNSHKITFEDTKREAWKLTDNETKKFLTEHLKNISIKSIEYVNINTSYRIDNDKKTACIAKNNE